MNGPDIAIWALCGVLGLMLGSFLNVCISRLPRGESTVKPRSRCPSCRTPIAWYDNVPVISFLLLGGRCRACRTPISIRYPIVEATTAVAFAVQAALVGDDPLRLASRLVLTALLIALFVTDLETQRLPDALTLPGIAAGLAFSTVLPPGIQSSAIGAALGAGLLLGIRWLWWVIKRVDAMGLGDVKMLAMVGAFLGWEQVWLVLLFASLTGAIVGIALTASGGRSMQSRLPFGTFLAVAALFASMFGQPLLEWYVGLL
jgi:leader peptidase (prepilin peptidase)/N-methyltransferase